MEFQAECLCTERVILVGPSLLCVVITIVLDILRFCRFYYLDVSSSVIHTEDVTKRCDKFSNCPLEACILNFISFAGER